MRAVYLQRKITVLEDNHPCASYNYLLSVHTGHRKSAGTSSNVRHLALHSGFNSPLHCSLKYRSGVFNYRLIQI